MVMHMTWEAKIKLWEKVMGFDVDSCGIEDLFEEGKPCFQEFEKILEAERSICSKLNVDECHELDTILSCWNKICMHVGIRMFDYGIQSKT